MMKVKCVFLVIALLLLGSCQFKDVGSLPQTSPTELEQTRIQSLTPALTLTPTSMISINSENIFIGTENGRYTVFNVSTHRSDSIMLSTECRILPNGRSAICEGAENAYLVDFQSGDQIEFPLPVDLFWSSIYNQFVVFPMQATDHTSVELIEYDFINGIETHIITYNPQVWFFPVIVSSDRNYIVGGRTMDTGIHLFTINPEDNTGTSISQEIVGTITDFAWSPVGSILGVGSTQSTYQDVTACTTTIFSIYDAATGRTRQVAHSPTGTCYSYFLSGYTRNIWSPDGTRVALLAGDRICVINVFGENAQNCLLVTQSEEVIEKTAWSPDSKNLAYLVQSKSDYAYSLRSISIDDFLQTVLIERFYTTNMIVDFTWSGP